MFEAPLVCLFFVKNVIINCHNEVIFIRLATSYCLL